MVAGGCRVRVGGSSGPAVGRQSEGPAVLSVSARPQRDGRIRVGFRRTSSFVWPIMYRVFCAGFVDIML